MDEQNSIMHFFQQSFSYKALFLFHFICVYFFEISYPKMSTSRTWLLFLVLSSVFVGSFTGKPAHNAESSEEQDLSYYEALMQK